MLRDGHRALSAGANSLPERLLILAKVAATQTRCRILTIGGAVTRLGHLIAAFLKG